MAGTGQGRKREVARLVFAECRYLFGGDQTNTDEKQKCRLLLQLSLNLQISCFRDQRLLHLLCQFRAPCRFKETDQIGGQDQFWSQIAAPIAFE